MSHTIWKFVLTGPDTVVRMPEGARILSTAEQDGHVCVWASCDPDVSHRPRRITAVNTGGLVPEGGVFIGTVLMRSSGLVWHVFEAMAMDSGV